MEHDSLEVMGGFSRTAAAHETMIRNAIARQAARITRIATKRTKLRRTMRVVDEQLRHERKLLRVMKQDTLP